MAGRRHYHGNRNNGQAAAGLTIMLIGALIGSPFLFYFGLFEYATAPLVTLKVTVGVGATAAATGGIIGFNLVTLGIGAAIIYAAIGLGFLYSAAKECYSEDKNVFGMIKSRVDNEDGLSVTGVIKFIGAVVWSPFLLIGGALGMAVRACVDISKNPKTSNEMGDSGIELEDMTAMPNKGSTVGMVQTLGVAHSSGERGIPQEPKASQPVFAGLPGVNENPLAAPFIIPTVK